MSLLNKRKDLLYVHTIKETTIFNTISKFISLLYFLKTVLSESETNYKYQFIFCFPVHNDHNLEHLKVELTDL